jgi:hypothetical protein
VCDLQVPTVPNDVGLSRHRESSGIQHSCMPGVWEDSGSGMDPYPQNPSRGHGSLQYPVEDTELYWSGICTHPGRVCGKHPAKRWRLRHDIVYRAYPLQRSVPMTLCTRGSQTAKNSRVSWLVGWFWEGSVGGRGAVSLLGGGRLND